MDMYKRGGKRLLDLLLAFLTLVLLFPFLAILAVVIRMAIGAPVLFRQERLGYKGRVFKIVKFRTMINARDGEGNLLPDADRLTRLGRFLRATSLDELPELLNIFRGEMSLVGPRPLYAHYRDRYTREQFRRHEVLPGLTGWAQVNGRNALSWEAKFDLDVWYVEHQSFLLDLKIIALTILKILRREGVNQPGQATAEEFKGSLN